MAQISISPQRLLRICILGYAGIALGFVLYFFALPGLIVGADIGTTPATAAIPSAAWRLERSLTPRYERWARGRLQSRQGEDASLSDVSGTEWPLFGSVFYLWSLEAMQEAWAQDQTLAKEAPAISARRAIDATTALVLDPSQAGWVRKYWGANYMRQENVFYRMLRISAMTSHARLTGQTNYVDALREEVDSLAAELGRSSTGLLDDYPHQCFPTDVLAAIAAIQASDTVTGTDHTDFVRQSRRAFQGCQLDLSSLVPYTTDSRGTCATGPARGCSNSFASLRAPLIWPDLATFWYDRYRSGYWQESWGAVGFREFRAGPGSEDWYLDVDAGPVLAGHGIAASAFGVGAARLNGRFDDAYPLTLEMLATSWPLPDGRLLIPRLLSNAIDAPNLGEAAILYNLTRLPARDATPSFGSKKPPFVFIVLGLYFLAAGALSYAFISQACLRLRQLGTIEVPNPQRVIRLWLMLALLVIASIAVGQSAIGLIALLVMGRVPNTGHAPSIPSSP